MPWNAYRSAAAGKKDRARHVAIVGGRPASRQRRGRGCRRTDRLRASLLTLIIRRRTNGPRVNRLTRRSVTGTHATSSPVTPAPCIRWRSPGMPPGWPPEAGTTRCGSGASVPSPYQTKSGSVSLLHRVGPCAPFLSPSRNPPGVNAFPHELLDKAASDLPFSNIDS